MTFLNYFDRIAIIHLRDRVDRYRALRRELWRLGIDITDNKVSIPDAPMPADKYGFATKGVHGNYLSHLDIIKAAQQDKLNAVWVLEDDAIFSRRFVREQRKIADFLATNEWDICYFGHTLTTELNSLAPGLPRYTGSFYWAHCYAVHSRIFARLLDYMEENLARPQGHPLGGKAYIDAAHTLFRRFNPDVVALVANPVMSVQRGSPSGLHNRRWYDRFVLTRPMIYLARAMRDECWRWTGMTFGGAAPKDLRKTRGK